METINTTKADFKVLKDAIRQQFDKLAEQPSLMVRLDVSKDKMWETYLASFPEGTNPIFKERREYDCNCCKQFIRAVGNAALLTEDGIVSLWDIDVPEPFKTVAKAMSKLMHEAKIRDAFKHNERHAGTDVSRALIDDKPVRFNHFHAPIPKSLFLVVQGRYLNSQRTQAQVFHRALRELTVSSCEMVLELIDQNSLYRGKEFRNNVAGFLDCKKTYDKLTSERMQEVYAWRMALSANRGVTGLGKSVMGELLYSVSEGMELEAAVRRYEQMVAPANYKRPTALVTKGMIERAQKKVQELGLMDSLPRRYAVTEDVALPNVLFADRATAPLMKDAFDSLKEDAVQRVNVAKLKGVTEISAEAFVKDVLPSAESLEVLVENRHVPNFFSLIAPVNPEAKGMLKWPNNFSWTYQGEVTDSIKEKVKKAGGNVVADFRASLGWYNGDDLDLHLYGPDNMHVNFRERKGPGGWFLDVDMNAGGVDNSVDPVENICLPNRANMKEGQYKLCVHQFNQRSTKNPGFQVEIEFDGELYSFHHKDVVRSKQMVVVAQFTYSKKHGLKMLNSLPEQSASKEVWGVNTQEYRKVRLVMNSPNHWTGHAIGNKHLFFVLDGCRNTEDARGFYNEFLSDDLHEHRKVFEMLGTKMRAPKSDAQLSGIGFSTTQRNHVIVRVKGATQRLLKVNF